MNRNRMLGALAAVTIATGSLWGTASTVHAQSPTDTMHTLVQSIAQKFGLKPADVQQVATEVRTKKQAELQQRMTDRLTKRLDEAVKAGTLTAAQKQLILDKHAQLQKERIAERQALETWAAQNKIDMSWFGVRGGRPHGMGMMGNGWK